MTRHDINRPMPAMRQPASAGHCCRRRALSMLLGMAASALLALPPARAQTAPHATEVARYSPLLAAAHRGDLAQLDALIAAGTDLAQRDGHGRTAVHVAAHARQRAVIERLARAGADLNTLEHDRYDAVTIAAVADDEATLRTLLKLGASAKQVTSRYDGTALIAAAHLGHEGVVRQLIAAGAPLDHVNNLRWTALIESIVLGDGGARHQATLAALLKAGANANLPDGQGRTPLALALARGYAGMAQALERAGGRP